VKRVAIATLFGVGVLVFAQDAAPRGNTDEWSLNLLVTGAKDIAFEGGAAARIDAGVGVGVSLMRNLNNHLAIGAEATWYALEYRARVAPGAGNAGAAFEADARGETIALRLNATWYLLSGRFTPFVTGGVGVNFIDPDLDQDPPTNACWIYPLYGQACGATVPSNSLTRLGYSAAAGLRWDLPGRQGFLRLLGGVEWIDLPGTSSPPSYAQVRLDFGVGF
jgi:hypothetical protein